MAHFLKNLIEPEMRSNYLSIKIWFPSQQEVKMNEVIKILNKCGVHYSVAQLNQMLLPRSKWDSWNLPSRIKIQCVIYKDGVLCFASQSFDV